MTAPHPRTVRSGGDLRILRAAVFAAVCVVLAGVGHTLGSCATIPLWTLGAGFLGVLLVTVPFAGRERSLPGIAALLAAGQTVLHTLFGLGQHGAATGVSGTVTTGASASDAALVEQAARLVCGTAAAAISPAQAQKLLTEARLAPTAGAHTPHRSADAVSTVTGATDATASLLPSLPMVLAHLLAALVAGWLLRRGDLALLRVAEMSALSAHSVAEGAFVRSLRGALALVRALRAGLPGAPEAGPLVQCADRYGPPEPRTLALQHTVIRRGPPAGAALVLAA
ncbi:hypothetical protein EJ357_22875 [Streptomyces cyaneochromogenes]|uniref:Integral membrane protein n=1 Tax=Streptomyces cyaneochromogenes TaxID=2496836 RepID=A0A3Q9ENT1_9ACTN|nr:hypothetical protein [Streptomyces cyaneochromogenes]AZQ35970.1 hypothetical protein EJ357_22875 [Streptomyces cyaneochromogenes]